MRSEPPRGWRGILRVGLAVQGLGLWLIALRRRTALDGALFLNMDWPEHIARGVDVAGATAAAAAGLWLLWRPSRLAAGYLTAWMGVALWATWLHEGSYFGDVLWPAWAIRVASPAILLGALLERAPERERALEWLMRAACAATFGAHGLEALWAHPRFIDLIFGAFARLGLRPAQAHVEDALVVIGVVDLTVAAAALLGRRWPKLAGWMALWGGITAASRVVEWGLGGVDLALLRACHVALPLALWWRWRQAAVTRTSQAATIGDPNPSQTQEHA